MLISKKQESSGTFKWKRAGKANQWKPAGRIKGKDADEKAIISEVLKKLPTIKGARGDKGEKGEKPKHKWDGTKLQFELPDGKWGKKVQLGGRGKGDYPGWLAAGVDFLELTDTPDSYIGKDDRLVTVDGTGLEFGVKMSVGDTEPTDPKLYDLWFDTT